MNDKGWILTQYTIICKCGYREPLERTTIGGESAAAKKQGWKWSPVKGWQCTECQLMTNGGASEKEETADTKG